VLFHELHEKGNTIVLVTHEPKLAARCPRAVRLVDGTVVADGKGRDVALANARRWAPRRSPHPTPRRPRRRARGSMSESALPLPLEAKPRQDRLPAQGGARVRELREAVAQAAYSLRAHQLAPRSPSPASAWASPC